MNLKKLLLASCLLLVPFLSFSKVSSLKYDHGTKISAMAHDTNKGILATGCEDGSLVIRNHEDYSILIRLQLDFNPIQEISISPIDTTVAVLQTVGGIYTINIWNYATGKRLYGVRLLDKPLFLDYSPSGNYLVYGALKANSLVIIESKSGKMMPWINNTTSIIQAQTMNPSDSVLLAYLASGEILSFNVKTGEILQKVQTLPNLSNTQFLIQNRTILLIGTLRDTVSIINATNGKEINSATIRSVFKIKADTPIGNLALASYQDGYTLIYQWNFLSKVAKPTNLATNWDFSKSTDFIYYQNKVICAHSDGLITDFRPSNATINDIDSTRILPFTGFSVNENILTLANKDSIYQVSFSDIFKNSDKINDSDILKKYDHQLNAPTAIINYNEQSFLAYNTTGEKGEIHLVDYDGKSAKKIFSTESPIKELKKVQSHFLGLTQDGKSFILNGTRLDETFSYEATGTTANEIISFDKLLTARSKDPVFNTSLIFINSDTKETVPLSSSDLITFDLCYTEELLTLYTIGIENRDGLIRTTLKAYRGDNLSNVQTLNAISGEDHKATLMFDPYTSNLYTTLGNRGISLLEWGGFTSTQFSGHNPMILGVNKQFIFALNEDGTFTAWQKSTGKEAFTLYSFDGELQFLKNEYIDLPENLEVSPPSVYSESSIDFDLE